MTTREWLEEIQSLSGSIAATCEQLKSHLEIYGEDGTFLGGQMALLDDYKRLRKFLLDNSHPAYQSEI
jgi:hypothetical protein